MPSLSAQAAAAFFTAVQALDPNLPERQELLAGGVARSTTEALYPATFAALVPGLIQHLRAHDVPLSFPYIALEDQRQQAQRAVWALPEDLYERWHAESPKELLLVDFNLLATFVKNLLGATPAAHKAARDFVTVVWAAWWLQGWRARLDEPARQQADLLACWVAEKLLPNLV